MVEGDSKLKQIKVEGSFLDSLIKLLVISIVSFNLSELSDKPGELAVKGYEVGSLYFLQNKVYMLFEVP